MVDSINIQYPNVNRLAGGFNDNEEATGAQNQR